MLPALLLVAGGIAGTGTAGGQVDYEDLARGLVYDGLQRVSRSAFCRGNFELEGVEVFGQPVCTHGPDPAPEGVDVREDREPPAPPAPIEDAQEPEEDGAGGEDGASGEDAVAGLEGEDGEEGMPAGDGAPGLDGEDGEDGEDGAAGGDAVGANGEDGSGAAETEGEGEEAGAAEGLVEATLSPGSGTAAATQVPCVGNGTDGFRVQLIYARASDRADGYAGWLPSLQQYAAQMNDVFRASAAETGGSRNVRFVHDANCVPSILNLVFSPSGDDNFTNTYNELRAKGYGRTDRKYLIWMDANVYCGIAEVYYDDQPGAANASNGSPSVPGEVGLVGKGCWGQPNSVEAHELVHLLGGVQTSAPNATSGNHCTDNHDRLCYSDGTGIAGVICGDPAHENRLDCNHDDYFSTNPAPGTYLATHWNTANSQFLSGGSAGSTPTTSPPTTAATTTTTTTAPPSTTTTRPPSTTTTSAPPTTTTTTTRPPSTTSLPSAPQNLWATQPTAGRGILLYWSPPSAAGNPSYTAYRVYRGTTSGNLTPLVDIGTATSTYTDTSATSGALYWYQVSAVSPAGEGPRSNLNRMIAR